MEDVPPNVFRSASPSKASRQEKLGGVEVRVVSFKTDDVKEDEIVYTVDEVEYMKGLNSMSDSYKAINTLKKEFGAAYIETKFDKIMESTQSKGVKNERVGIHQRIKGFNSQNSERSIRFPLEEQQRYITRPS